MCEDSKHTTANFIVRSHTSCLKLKRGGKGRPLGRRALGSRSSSKKECVHASNCSKNNSQSMNRIANGKTRITGRVVHFATAIEDNNRRCFEMFIVCKLQSSVVLLR